MLAALARGAYDHRRLVVLAWLAIAVAGAVTGPRLFERLDTSMGLRPDVESAVATQRLSAIGGAPPDLVVLLDGRPQTDSELRAAVASLARDLWALPATRSVVAPGDVGARGLVSQDGQAQLLTVSLRPGLDAEARDDALAAVQEAAGQAPVPRVVVGGAAAFDEDFAVASERQLVRGELVAFPIVLLLLLLILRSGAALAIPLLVAAGSVLAALLVLQALQAVTTVSAYAVNVVTMVGLGLAVDYGLLLIIRFREEVGPRTAPRHAAGPVSAGLAYPTGGARDAVVRTMTTAGRTVAFSGLTVAVALSGLLVFSESLLRSLAWGAGAVTLLTVAVALTLVPALLGSWGRRIPPARPSRGESGAFARLARVVQRRALLVATGVTALLLVLGLPFLDVVLGGSDARSLPAAAPSRQVAEVVAERFPGGGVEPVVVVADPLAPAERADLVGRLESVPGVAQAVARPELAPVATVIDVVPAEPEDVRAGTDLVRRVRALDTAVPVAVTGSAASLLDFQESLAERLPAALAVMTGATLVLLFLLTRSVVLPVKALVMNVLSLSASFGALVWVFQEGNLAWLLDFTPVGSVDTTVPLLIFVFAFGLSMDYEVFLLSRIREFYDRWGDSERAVAAGLQATGGIVTSAALLMVVVFLGFAAGELLVVKELGIGIAVAVVLDATLVRCLLVPAMMTLLGRWNWWAPARLVRGLPVLEGERPAPVTPRPRHAARPPASPVR